LKTIDFHGWFAFHNGKLTIMISLWKENHYGFHYEIPQSAVKLVHAPPAKIFHYEKFRRQVRVATVGPQRGVVAIFQLVAPVTLTIYATHFFDLEIFVQLSHGFTAVWSSPRHTQTAASHVYATCTVRMRAPEMCRRRTIGLLSCAKVRYL
jgi:hypothetical protein